MNNLPRSLLKHIHVLVLLAIIAVYVTYKYRSIGLPFYWDEAWSYAPAVYAMHSNGPSLFPGAIDPELSRGHPLLFYFTGSTWMKLFGPSRSSVHYFALIISIALLLSVYHIAKQLSSSKVIGFASMIFLAVQEPFIAQGNLFLPELFLAFISLWLAYSFLKRWYLGIVTFGTLALLTKESAIVIIVSLILFQLTKATIWRSESKRNTGLTLLSLTLPILGLSLHFIYQYILYGWFFFPEHMSLISWDLKDIIYKMKITHLELFERQRMEWSMYAFAIISPFFFKPWPYRAWPFLVGLLYVTAIKVLFGRWTLPVTPTLIVTLICLTLIFLIKFGHLNKRDEFRGQFLSLSFLFFIGYLLFTSLNFYTDRYLLSLFPFIAIAFPLFLYWTFQRFGRLWVYGSILFLILLIFSSIGIDDKIGDTRLNYVNAIKVHQDLVKNCEDLGLHDEKISMTFIEQFYLQNDIAGYLSTRPFTNTTTSFGMSTQYVIFSNASPNALLEQREALNFEVLSRVQHGPVWGEVQIRP